MYKELVLEASKGNEWVSIQPPCPESERNRAEETVGCAFPEELRKLLSEMNGDQWLLLSAQQIIENVERNKNILYPLFETDFGIEAYKDRIERFLFFAANGCGDYYCYRISKEGIADESAIYIWNHEDIAEECCWSKVADSLAECIVRYYHDEI